VDSLTVSAILPVYNCEKTIGTVLDCLFAAMSADYTFEVVAVDDASTDGTAEICNKYPVNLIHLSENHGPAYCRNLGVRSSTGNVLLFLDSDIEFAPDLLGKMLGRLADDADLAGIYTLTSPDPLNRTFTSRYFALQEYLRFMDVIEGGCAAWSFISTRCGLLRRSVFEETGGFNENFANAAYEDLEFSSRMDDRHQLALHPDFLVRHYWPSTLWKMLRRLHVNARGVIAFPPNMRRKASVPFVKDRNARAWIGVSWLFLLGGGVWWPLYGAFMGAQFCAIHQIFWLIRGCMRHEGIGFTLKAWGAYNLTVLPFVTGVGMGVLDKMLASRRGSGKKI